MRTFLPLFVLCFLGLSPVLPIGTTQAASGPVAGSYRPAKINSQVKKAAAFAVQAHAKAVGKKLKLVGIVSAETQVVAGVNYRLRLKVAGNGKTAKFTAIVYQNLKGKYALKSWK